MLEGDLAKLVNDVLAPILGPVGFLTAEVEIAPDPAGDDALLVTTHFKPEAEVTTGRAYIDAQVALMDALAARGDVRFPYFR